MFVLSSVSLKHEVGESSAIAGSGENVTFPGQSNRVLHDASVAVQVSFFHSAEALE